MPLFELYRNMTKENPDATQGEATNISSVPSSIGEDEFAELIWDNGPVTQSQSSKPRRSSAQASENKDTPASFGKKFAHFGEVDPTLNRSSSRKNSAHTVWHVHDDDDDLVPWANIPVHGAPLPAETLQNDYFCEFLTEFEGLDQNLLPVYKNTMPVNESGGSGQEVRHSGERLNAPSESPRPSRKRNLSQHYRSSVPIPKPRTHDSGTIASTVAQQDNSKDLSNTRLQYHGAPSSIAPKASSGGLGVMNFSHFLRPAAGGLRSHERVSTASDSRFVEPTLIDSNSACRSAGMIPGQTVSASPTIHVGASAKPRQEVVSVEQAPGISQLGALKKKDSKNAETGKSMPPNLPSSSFAASVAVGKDEGKEVPETIGMSSSSSSSEDSDSVEPNRHRHREKRRICEREDSGYHSKDNQDESVGIRRPACGQGKSAKRSRAAEVHNLSERRRRDRINEKMRALQELIPNCNKVDKASMLEEAIEYLKTLQMQVQMMSMASGLFMPQMILPHTMQHIHFPTMAHLSPMGMGMGYGLGFRIGGYDMNSSPGFPMVPIQPMPPQFPIASISGQAGMQGLPISVSPQILGVSGQGVPMPMPGPSPFNLSPSLPNLASEPPGTSSGWLKYNSVNAANSEDRPEKNSSIEAPEKRKANGSQIPTSNQASKY